MTQHEFENRVLHLWMTTRVPLTRANLLYFTQVPRKKLDAWLDAMVAEGVADVDSDDEGEMIWTVRGAQRAARGPERIEDVVKLDALRSEVAAGRSGGSSTDLPARVASSLPAARGVVEQALARRGGEKNPLIGGALGLLGPLGWLYAAPVKEAVPAAIVFYIAYRVLGAIPLLGWPLLSVLSVLSVIVGVLYAFQYNRAGQVTSLFSDDDARPRLPGAGRR